LRNRATCLLAQLPRQARRRVLIRTDSGDDATVFPAWPADRHRVAARLHRFPGSLAAGVARHPHQRYPENP